MNTSTFGSDDLAKSQESLYNGTRLNSCVGMAIWVNRRKLIASLSQTARPTYLPTYLSIDRFVNLSACKSSLHTPACIRRFRGTLLNCGVIGSLGICFQICATDKSMCDGEAKQGSKSPAWNGRVQAAGYYHLGLAAARTQGPNPKQLQASLHPREPNIP